jgi:hypothetical protein
MKAVYEVARSREPLAATWVQAGRLLVGSISKVNDLKLICEKLMLLRGWDAWGEESGAWDSSVGGLESTKKISACACIRRTEASSIGK